MVIFTQYNHYGEFYFKQGRNEFGTTKGCVCLCFVKYEYRNQSRQIQFFEEFVRKSTPYLFNYGQSIHAEKMAIETVNRTERIEHATCIRLELYSSMSPCSKCCTLLQHFLLDRPYCRLYIAFSSIYRHDSDEHRFALRQLNKLENVKLLDIFTIREWCLLKERGFLSMTPKDLRKIMKCSRFWKEHLKEITTYGMYQEDSAVYSEDITIDGVEVDYNSYFQTQVNPEKAKKYEEGSGSVTGMLLSLGLLVGLLLTTLYWFLWGY